MYLSYSELKDKIIKGARDNARKSIFNYKIFMVSQKKATINQISEDLTLDKSTVSRHIRNSSNQT